MPGKLTSRPRSLRWSLFRHGVRDCTAGFRCYSRAVLEGIDPFDVRASGYSFLEEMVWRIHHAGFSIREIPIVFEDRRLGVSKIDQVEILRAARHVLMTALRPTQRATRARLKPPQHRSTADRHPPPPPARRRGAGSDRTPRRAPCR